MYKKNYMALTLLLALGVSSIGARALAEESVYVEAQDVQPVEDAAMQRGVDWTLSAEETAQLEGVVAQKKKVIVKDVDIYGFTATLTYNFDDTGRMISRRFKMKSSKSAIYESQWYSVFVRYGNPLSMKRNETVWKTEDLRITLSRKDGNVITFEKIWPKEDTTETEE